MDRLKPKLFTTIKDYTKEQFMHDVVSGVIVAIIALPLSIALALASGVTPERGIYTAIIAGFFVSFLGGSRVQIAGPTAAFATIVAGIVAKSGMEGLAVATIMAGILLVLMGLLGLGNLIKFIPYTITTGFTAGIAVTLFVGQIKDFLGLTVVTKEPLIDTGDKVVAYWKAIDTLNPQALLVGVVCVAVLIVWPKLKKVSVIPSSLIAIVVSILMVKGFRMQVDTIGDLYEISNKLPSFTMPSFSFKLIRSEFNDAITIALLAAIESLLSAVVADSMVNGRHRSNMELVAQGAGNVASAFFGGIPATGAIARTAANVKNGGRTPVAGIVHSIALLLILIVLMPYAAWIPMPAIAAILFGVAYNMCGWKKFVALCKTAPKSDIAVLVTTFVLTVVFDLVVAIEVGMVLASMLFMKRMSDVTSVEGWKYIEDDEEDPDSLSLRVVPDKVLVYEISGPMFFGAADKILDISVSNKDKVLILRMRSVGAIDATALHSLEQLLQDCQKKGITLVLSHTNEQPLHMMEKAGFDKKIGKENFCKHIDEALERAERILENECP